MHTEREYMMRCLEAIASSGMREPARMIRDAKTLHEEVMSCKGEMEPAAMDPAAQHAAGSAGAPDDDADRDEDKATAPTSHQPGRRQRARGQG